MFREYLAGRSYLRDTYEIQMSPSCPDSSYSSHARHMHHFARCLLTSYPQKHFSLQFALSLHTLSLSHTTLTNKSHMKYKVHSIEHNYNQIWHGIKANKTHSCKLQLYRRDIKLVTSYLQCLNGSTAKLKDAQFFSKTND